MRYYVVETKDMRPDTLRSGSLARNSCVIQTEPGLTNMSHEPREEGWLGTANDISETAHGVFDSLDAARDKCEALGYAAVGGTAEHPDGDDRHDESIVERWHVEGEEYAVEDWIHWPDYSPSVDGLTAASTDDEIQAVADRLDSEAASEGIRLMGDVAAHVRYCIQCEEERA